MTKIFDGEAGRRRLVELLSEQKSVRGDVTLAAELAEIVETQRLKEGDVLINEGDLGSDLYFILDGAMDVWIRKRKIAQRVNGNTVGEMAAIQPGQARSATVKAASDSIVARLSEPDLERIGQQVSNCLAPICARIGTAPSRTEPNYCPGKGEDSRICGLLQRGHRCRGVDRECVRA